MKSKSKLLPKYIKLLQEVGENIRLARLRRKLTMHQVSERAGISRPTLHSVEKGEETVSIGTVLRVLKILGLHQDVLNIASDDIFGRKLQDIELLNKEKSEKDVLREFKSKIRSKISIALLRGSYEKNSFIGKILGCDYDEFIIHLENNPYDFKVTDRDLDLDHIVPISSAKNKEDIIKLNHYTNFQLLPSYYNQNIKNNNKWDSKDFDRWFKNW